MTDNESQPDTLVAETDKLPTMPAPALPDDDDNGTDWSAVILVVACVGVLGLVLGFVMSVEHWSQDYWWPIGLAVGLAVTAWITARWREAVIRFVLPWLALFAGVVFVCAAIGFPIWAIHQRDELSNRLSHITMPTFTIKFPRFSGDFSIWIRLARVGAYPVGVRRVRCSRPPRIRRVKVR